MIAVVVSHRFKANTLSDVARYMYVDNAGVVCGNTRAEGGRKSEKVGG